MPGPSRTPRHLRALKGTVRPYRDTAPTPTLAPLDVVPTPPAWLTDLEARRYWTDLAPILTVNKLLTTGNLGLLAQLCALHGKLVAIGENREMQPNAALLSQYRAYLGALGLLGWPTPKAKDPANRFAKHTRPIGHQTRENR